MNRILITSAEITDGDRVRLGDYRAAHILRHLKPQTGQTLRIGVLNGPTGTGTVMQASETTVDLHCRFDAHPPPPPRVDLLLALPRPKIMRRLWAPLAMLGVRRIILTNAARVERNYFDTHWLDPQTYTPRLIEGLEQSGDTHVPEVLIRRRFKPLIEDELDSLCGKSVVRLCAHPDETVCTLPIASETHLLLAVGPEGGWTDFELSLLDENRFDRIALGWRRLRTDVACTALLAVIDSRRQHKPSQKADL